MYKQKTRNEYEIQGDYGFGHGFECVCTEDNWDKARERVKEYRINEPGYTFKIVKKRVRISEGK